MKRVHANALYWPDQKRGVLIRADAGGGKSEQSLRLIDTYNIQLIGDDYVDIFVRNEMLFAQPVPHLAGLLEMRGIGIIRLAPTQICTMSVPIALVIDLGERADMPRMVAAEAAALEGVRLPLLHLSGHDSITAVKIHYAMQTIARTGYIESGIYDL